MIEPTDEMLNAYERAAEAAFGQPTQGSLVGLAAVLAIVARDRCMQARGHDAGADAALMFGGVTDSSTGMDQTPWPSCEGCKP